MRGTGLDITLRTPQSSVDLNYPLPAFLRAAKCQVPAVHFTVRDPAQICWRSAFEASQASLGIAVGSASEAKAVSQLWAPVVISIADTVFYHVWNQQGFAKLVKDHGYAGYLPGPTVVYPMPCVSERIFHMPGIQWRRELNCLVRLEREHGWVVVVAQVEAPSTALLTYLPVRAEQVSQQLASGSRTPAHASQTTEPDKALSFLQSALARILSLSIALL